MSKLWRDDPKDASIIDSFKDIVETVSCPKCGQSKGKFCSKKQKFIKPKWKLKPHMTRIKQYKKSIEIKQKLDEV